MQHYTIVWIDLHHGPHMATRGTTCMLAESAKEARELFDSKSRYTVCGIFFGERTELISEDSNETLFVGDVPLPAYG